MLWTVEHTLLGMDTHAALDKGNIGKMKPFSVFQYDVLSMNCEVTNMQWDVLNIV